MATIRLPTADRRIEDYTTAPPRRRAVNGIAFNRVAYAAAHVVADPLADWDPWVTPAIDWEATLRFREYLWDLGLGVAEDLEDDVLLRAVSFDGDGDLLRLRDAGPRGPDVGRSLQAQAVDRGHDVAGLEIDLPFVRHRDDAPARLGALAVRAERDHGRECDVRIDAAVGEPQDPLTDLLDEQRANLFLAEIALRVVADGGVRKQVRKIVP